MTIDAHKGLLMMITEDRLLTYCELHRKGELSFLRDTLVKGGEKSVMGKITQKCVT